VGRKKKGCKGRKKRQSAATLNVELGGKQSREKVPHRDSSREENAGGILPAGADLQREGICISLVRKKNLPTRISTQAPAYPGSDFAVPGSPCLSPTFGLTTLGVHEFFYRGVLYRSRGPEKKFAKFFGQPSGKKAKLEKIQKPKKRLGRHTVTAHEKLTSKEHSPGGENAR